LRIAQVAQRVDAADQLVELEDRVPRRVRRLVKRGSKRWPNQCRMAKLALLTLCMSPVIAVGAISEVLR